MYAKPNMSQELSAHDFFPYLFFVNLFPIEVLFLINLGVTIFLEWMSE